MNLAKISSKLFIAIILIISISVSMITSVYMNQYLDRYLQSLNTNLAFENRFVSGTRALPGSYAEALEGIRKVMKDSGAIFYEKQELTADIDDFIVRQELAMGVVLTSDGWLISADFPVGLRADDLRVEIDDIFYDVVDIINLPEEGISFVRVNATNLKPIAFADTREFLSGDQLIVMDKARGLQPVSLHKNSLVTNINLELADFEFLNEWVFNNLYLEEGVVFDGNGRFAGLFKDNGEYVPLHRKLTLIRSLLAEGEVSRPGLGIKVINLTGVGNLDIVEYARLGALITEIDDSELGLQVGDVITAIDGRLLSRTVSIADILSNSVVGDEVRVTLVNEDGERTIGVLLKDLQELNY